MNIISIINNIIIIISSNNITISIMIIITIMYVNSSGSKLQRWNGRLPQAPVTRAQTQQHHPCESAPNDVREKTGIKYGEPQGTGKNTCNKLLTPSQRCKNKTKKKKKHRLAVRVCYIISIQFEIYSIHFQLQRFAGKGRFICLK